jgi:hypothetical protein
LTISKQLKLVPAATPRERERCSRDAIRSTHVPPILSSQTVDVCKTRQRTSWACSEHRAPPQTNTAAIHSWCVNPIFWMLCVMSRSWCSVNPIFWMLCVVGRHLRCCAHRSLVGNVLSLKLD